MKSNKNKLINVAINYITRTPYQAVGAILVMTLTFFISAVFLILAYGSSVVLDWFETRPQITAFLKDDVKNEQVEELQNSLRDTGKVKEIKFISKTEALSIYKDWTKGEPLLQEMVTANLLPASLEISVQNINQLTDIAQLLKSSPQINEVIFPEDIITSLTSFTSALRKIGVILLVFIGLVSLLEILVIIGLKIAIRKEEIEILRLIGASSWYIRKPFIYEGVIYGVGGAFLGWLLGYLVLLYSTPFLISYFAEVSLLPYPPLVMFEILGVLILAGIIIGIFGSFLAVKRYLR